MRCKKVKLQDGNEHFVDPSWIHLLLGYCSVTSFFFFLLPFSFESNRLEKRLFSSKSLDDR
jgi:hypothetical protein